MSMRHGKNSFRKCGNGTRGRGARCAVRLTQCAIPAIGKSCSTACWDFMIRSRCFPKSSHDSSSFGRLDGGCRNTTACRTEGRCQKSEIRSQPAAWRGGQMPAEYVDIVDRNGNSLGRITQRSRVHWNGDWHRSAHLWIENGRGEVLIQKRCLDKESHPGQWDVSCAGHVLAGDSTRQTALREAREELGVTISPLELRSLGTVRQCFTDGNRHDNEIVDIFCVRRDLQPDTCVLQEDEVEAVRLISVAELEKRIAAQDPDFVPHPAEYPRLFAYLAKR
ncbi:MAG: NUDIX domain-containing protein [Chitinivibrionales bacterium]|nr:NUDIX domain-containing protein [Chitinivibrionales bacterium]MBD3396691.1 NUDIX domain-containing protein [Chitinivibrionales bacterium]